MIPTIYITHENILCQKEILGQSRKIYKFGKMKIIENQILSCYGHTSFIVIRDKTIKNFIKHTAWKKKTLKCNTF